MFDGARSSREAIEMVVGRLRHVNVTNVVVEIGDDARADVQMSTENGDAGAARLRSHRWRNALDLEVLVLEVNIRLRHASIVADLDRRRCLLIDRPRAAFNLNRDFVVHQLAWNISYLDFSSNVVFANSQVASLDAHQSSAFNRPAQRLNREDLRSGTFSRTTVHTSVVEHALLVAPRALILWIARHAQTAVGVLLVRSEHVAFVERDADGVDVVITVPGHINLGFILISVRLVRILKRER